MTTLLANDSIPARCRAIADRVAAAATAAGHPARLVAVGKTRPAADLRAAHSAGLGAFGENYVQEALAKQRELSDLALEWHLIGPLQSNKCREVARHFDWLQSLDRLKLVALLARERAATGRPPLAVLIQVNIDDEVSKSGCAPDQVDTLAAAIAAEPALALRGLMAIPAPDPDPDRRRLAFRRMRTLFDALHRRHPGIDTLSMGMSEDFELAIAEGATLVRVGSSLFGPRAPAAGPI